MAELNEVEAVRRRLERDAVGVRIAGVQIFRAGTIRPQRASEFHRHARGAAVEAAARRAKHLFVRLSNGYSLHIHLRMTGNLYVMPDSQPPPATSRLLFLLDDGRALTFNDPRCLGRVHLHPTATVEEHLPPLGPEPLSPEFTAKNFLAIARRSKQPAKSFLLDQSQIAGLGNIYAAEALYEARIDPRVPIGALGTRKLNCLYRAIRDVLSTAIPCCERAYEKPGSFSEGDQYPAAVYGREGCPCPRCLKPVARITQSGRSTYFCPVCQRGVP